MTSANLANNLVNLVDKAQNDELTVLDLTTFAISTLFWTNSAMNLQTAEQIIKTTQSQVLQGYSKSPRDSYNPLKRNLPPDNAEFIRLVKNIENLKGFFENATFMSNQNGGIFFTPFAQKSRRDQRYRYRTCSENGDTDEDDECICEENWLKVLYFNGQSVNPGNRSEGFTAKIAKIERLIQTEQPDLVAIVETWLTERHADHQVKLNLGLLGYDIFRQDRGTSIDNNNAQMNPDPNANRRGGGILLAVKHGLRNVTVSRDTSEDDWDMIANFDIVQTIECSECAEGQHKRKYGLAIVYRRPAQFSTQSM